MKIETANGASMVLNNDDATPTGNADIVMTPKGSGKVDIQGSLSTTGNIIMAGDNSNKFIKQF